MEISGNTVLITGGATGNAMANLSWKQGMKSLFVVAGKKDFSKHKRTTRICISRYGMTEGLLKASRAELDKSFQQMNSRR